MCIRYTLNVIEIYLYNIIYIYLYLDFYMKTLSERVFPLDVHNLFLQIHDKDN